jgi:hypothetical protein
MPQRVVRSVKNAMSTLMWLLERKNVFRFLSEILPESKFKEHLKSVLYEGLRLAKMESLPVKNWESIDGRLILEFENGLKLVSNVYRMENQKEPPLVTMLYEVFVRNFYLREYIKIRSEY